MGKDLPETQDIKLADGLDFGSIVVAIEQSFEVRFPDEAFAQVETLGQLHDVIWARLADDGSGGVKCATSMSFYRLKAQIAKSNPYRRLRPTTSLKSIANFNYATLREGFTGWAMPAVQISGFGCLSILVLAIGINLPLAPYFKGWTFLAFVLSSILLTGIFASFFPATYPAEKTLGDLARKIAAKNMHRLCVEGGALTSTSVWQAIVTLVADKIDMNRNNLSRESRFL